MKIGTKIASISQNSMFMLHADTKCPEQSVQGQFSVILLASQHNNNNSTYKWLVSSFIQNPRCIFILSWVVDIPNMHTTKKIILQVLTWLVAHTLFKKGYKAIVVNFHPLNT